MASLKKSGVAHSQIACRANDWLHYFGPFPKKIVRKGANTWLNSIITHPTKQKKNFINSVNSFITTEVYKQGLKTTYPAKVPKNKICLYLCRTSIETVVNELFHHPCEIVHQNTRTNGTLNSFRQWLDYAPHHLNQICNTKQQWI